MFFKPKPKAQPYDRQNTRPVIRASICTGEKVAGFQDLRTGRITEVMLLRTDGDLAAFCRQYGVEQADIVTQY